MTKDGKPYGPERFNQIIEERYLISKSIHTSYNEVGKITPRERIHILKLITDELKRTKEKVDEIKKQQKVK